MRDNLVYAIIEKRLQGGALYIAVVIAICIGAVLSLFILLSGHQQRTVDEVLQQSRLDWSLKSGLEIAGSAYFNENLNNIWRKCSGSDDSLRVLRRRWGAYDLVTVTCKSKRASAKVTAIYGYPMSKNKGLVVANSERPIGVAGKLVLHSDCYLPSGGIRPAYIDGQSFQGAQGNTAFIKAAPAQIPKLPVELRNSIIDMYKETASQDSVVQTDKPVLNQSFSCKTVLFQPENGRMSHRYWKGNIKIKANSIELDSSCHFEDVFIVCNKIRIRAGFRGNLHVMATDSIIVEDNCVLDYPSSFVLGDKTRDPSSMGVIQLGESSSFSGTIMSLELRREGQLNTFVKVGNTSVVNGLIYAEGFLHLAGQLNATIIAEKLLVKTSSAVYENHVLGCEINSGKYANILSTPVSFDGSTHLGVCKTLK